MGRPKCSTLRSRSSAMPGRPDACQDATHSREGSWPTNPSRPPPFQLVDRARRLCLGNYFPTAHIDNPDVPSHGDKGRPSCLCAGPLKILYNLRGGGAQNPHPAAWPAAGRNKSTTRQRSHRKARQNKSNRIINKNKNQTEINIIVSIGRGHHHSSSIIIVGR